MIFVMTRVVKQKQHLIILIIGRQSFQSIGHFAIYQFKFELFLQTGVHCLLI